jgi:hypothetical protein
MEYACKARKGYKILVGKPKKQKKGGLGDLATAGKII